MMEAGGFEPPGHSFKDKPCAKPPPYEALENPACEGGVFLYGTGGSDSAGCRQIRGYATSARVQARSVDPSAMAGVAPPRLRCDLTML